MDYLIIFTCIAMQFLIFCMGLYIGKVFGSNVEVYESKKSFKNSIPEKNKTIIIDDKKLVLNIKTDGLEKKFDSITEETSVDSDISSSVNKLKSMKG
jgi:hypothetical protein